MPARRGLCGTMVWWPAIPPAGCFAALAEGLHCVDLTDNATFCAEITCLDAEAKGAGRCMLSGLCMIFASILVSLARAAPCDAMWPINGNGPKRSIMRWRTPCGVS